MRPKFVLAIQVSQALRENCPNTEFFLVCIFQHSDCILRIFPYSVRIREKTDQKKLRILDTFHAVNYYYLLKKYGLQVYQYGFDLNFCFKIQKNFFYKIYPVLQFNNCIAMLFVLYFYIIFYYLFYIIFPYGFSIVFYYIIFLALIS